MIKLASIILTFAALTFLIGCQLADTTTSPIQLSNSPCGEGVTIELSMPHGDSLRALGVCWDENPVDVIIRNQTDSVIHFYQDWNSWGYYNLTFEIETYDSTYTVKKTKMSWFKNFPSFHSINPNQSLVFRHNLVDSSCFEHNASIDRLKGLKQWTGLPQKDYKSAKIRVIYELPEEYNCLTRPWLNNRNSHKENESNSSEDKNNTIYMFSKKLISEPINIRIASNVRTDIQLID